MIAMSRSRGLSITRVATTPAGVTAEAHAHGERLLAVRAGGFLKSASRLNATRGR